MRLRLLWASLVILVVGGIAAPAAMASGQVVDSSPRSGDIIAGPLPSIWLLFDETVATSTDTFVVTDTSGVEYDHQLTKVSARVTLSFDPPLGAGSYRIHWTVGSGNTIRRGALPFDVVIEGAAGTATPAPGATPVPSAEPGTNEAGVAEPTRQTPVSELSEQVGRWLTWDRLDELGLLVRDLGSLLVVGTIIFLALAMRGTAEEVEGVARWTRNLVGLAIAGATVQVLAVGAESIAQQPGQWSDLALWGDVLTPGRSAVAALTLSGALLVGTLYQSAALYPVLIAEAPVAPQPLPVGGGGIDTLPRPSTQPRTEWAFDLSTAPLAQAGAVLLLFAVTLEAGLRHGSVGLALVVLVHLTAVATWLGTTVGALVVLAGRFIRRQPLDAARLLSRSGTLVVIAVGVALSTGLAATLLADGWNLTGAGDSGPLLKTVAGILAAGAAVLLHKVLAGFLSDQRAKLSTVARSLLGAEIGLLVVAIVATAVMVA